MSDQGSESSNSNGEKKRKHCHSSDESGSLEENVQENQKEKGGNDHDTLPSEKKKQTKKPSKQRKPKSTTKEPDISSQVSSYDPMILSQEERMTF